MPNANTNFREGTLDLSKILVSKEFLIESFPQLLNQNKIPTLWTWGSGSCGRLGDNTSIDRSSPVQTIAGGTNWRSVCGDRTIAAIKTDGTLWMWGSGNYGQLGNNYASSGQQVVFYGASSPVQTISGGTNWRSVSPGEEIIAAIKTDGTLWTWGNNPYGVLGINNNDFGVRRSSPVQTVAGGTNWRSVSMGRQNAAAIKTDGTLWTWGSGRCGALGSGNVTNRSSPVQTISGGTNWRSVSVGVDSQYSIAAIKTDGTLWTWGCNCFGVLGDNTTASKSSPVQTVAGGTNWKLISNNGTMAAIKTDGTLWTWGLNFGRGTLGDSSSIHRSSPVQTVAGGTNWRLVGASRFCMVSAIKTDGTLWTWGYGRYGRLGTNSTVHRSSPVQTVSGGSNWRSVFGSTAIRDLDAD
jgi:alpha-tubulin suppressor-like RCC1 family protein